MLNNDYEQSMSNEPEDSGIEFIPLHQVPSLEDVAFSLFESDGEQVVKTPFGMIKIAINVNGNMGALAEEIKGMFTSGLSIKGIEKLNEIIAASPDVAKVIGQVPGLQHFLNLALEQMRGETRESGDWNPGRLTWQRLAPGVNLN